MEALLVGSAFALGVALAWAYARKSREVERARLEERERRIAELKDELRDALALETGLRGRVEKSVEERAASQAALEAERRAVEEKLRLVDEGRARLAESFQALSAEALRTNREDFLQLARTSLEKYQEGAKGDLDHRQKAIEQMVKPV